MKGTKRAIAYNTRIFVTVGTDHHPFTRLIEWLDRWSSSQPPGVVRLFFQVGTSAPPSGSPWSRYLKYQDMAQALADATVVVCHAGPATIVECRSAGVLPIVVPRERRFGEHVDDHQVRFARKMAQERQIALARSEADLHDLLAQAVIDSNAFCLNAAQVDAAGAIQSLDLLVQELLNARLSRLSRRRGPSLMRFVPRSPKGQLGSE